MKKPDDDTPHWVTPADWCKRTGMKMNTTYELMGTGELRAKKRGWNTLIDFRHGLAYLDSLPDFQPVKRREPEVA